MGKIKDVLIDKMNDENQMAPPPDMIDTDSDRSMWVIKDYKVWARNYEEALQLADIIDSF